MNGRSLVAVLAAACLAAAAVLWLGPVIRENRATREAIGRLQESIDRQTHEIEQLQRELRLLRTDYRAIERVAREKFGLCRPGEQIFHFEEPPAGPGEGSAGGAAGNGSGAAASAPGP